MPSDPNAPTSGTGSTAPSTAPAPAPGPAPPPGPVPSTATTATSGNTPVAGGTRAARAQRAQAAKDLLKHVLDQVFDVDPDSSPLALALARAGVNSIDSMLALSESDISTLEYADPTNTNITPLLPAVRNQIRLFAQWHLSLLQDGRVTNGEEYRVDPSLDYQAFGLFRIQNPVISTPPPVNSMFQTPKSGPLGSGLRTPGSGVSSTISTKSLSPAESFQRGIKKSITDFEPLVNFDDFDEWQRQFVSTADMHNCGDVLTPHFVPSTAEAKELFIQQNKFMYNVFQTVLKGNPIGNMFVRNHYHSGDAQQVWADLLKYRMTSSVSRAQATKLIKDLAGGALNASYPGTSVQYITDFEKKAQEYNDHQGPTEKLSDSTKKALLRQGLDGVKVFHDLHEMEDLALARNEPETSYVQYFQSVLNSAEQHDKKMAALARQRKLRSIHSTEVNPMYDINNMSIADIKSYLAQFLEDSGEDYDASDPPTARNFDAHRTFVEEPNEDDDEMPSQLSLAHDQFGQWRPETYAAGRTLAPPTRTARPSMPSNQYNKLSKSAQLLWNQLPEADRHVILHGPDKSSKLPAPAPSTSQKTRKPPYRCPMSSSTRNVRFSDVGDASADTLDEDTVPSPTSDYLVRSSSISSTRSQQSSASDTADVRRLLSQIEKKTSPQRDAHVTEWHTSALAIHSSNSLDPFTPSLIDRGANGGIAGSGTRLISATDKSIHITGIGNYKLQNLPVVTAGAVAHDDHGDPVILILHQYAHHPDGKTIHSSIQLEAFNASVDDRSRKLCRDSSQAITTLDGHVFPLSMVNGLPYLHLRPFTDDEWSSLPHVVLTSDVDWNPQVFDDDVSHAVHSHEQPFRWDAPGHAGSSYPMPTSLVPLLVPQAMATIRVPNDPDFEDFRQFFLWVPRNVVQRTFEATTQYARSGWVTGSIYDTQRAPFPALNVHRRNEPVATDLIYSDTPAIDNGSTRAQFFVGTRSYFCDVISMRNEGQFLAALQEVIRQRGAMDKLISDRAKVEISTKVKDLLRHLYIRDWQSEPHHQHQNPAERRFQNVKRNVNMVLNATGAPPSYWFLCLEYVCFIMNRTSMASLKWRTPFEALNGSTPDISMIYRFRFNDRIYFKRVDSGDAQRFPSLSDEVAGYFVGFAETVGHLMTYKVVSDESHRILFRSRIRLASERPNLRLEPDISPIVIDGSEDGSHQPPDSTPPSIVRSDPAGTFSPMGQLDPDDLIGRSFLTDPQSNGERTRLHIIEALRASDEASETDPDMIEFRCANSKDTVEEVLSYNDIIEMIWKNEEEGVNEREWNFTTITGHEGPLHPGEHGYNGSKYNVQIRWEDGSTTFEPLSIIARAEPVTCALYALKNGLLHLDGWKQFRRIARRKGKLERLANQAKRRYSRLAKRYKFGVEIPSSYNHALELDRRNGNTLWHESIALELSSIHSYRTFEDKGLGFVPPPDYKRIRVHFVFDVKHDGRRKARLVAGGHLTGIPDESVYSGVVSLRGIRLVILLAELNGLEVWATDVGNAYLEAFNKEKVYIIAGQEFGDLQGHTLFFRKALYGLKTSGKRWHERLAEILLDLGFFPSRAEPDIWMRDCGDHYEYIAIYVDDLIIASRNPAIIIDFFVSAYKLTLKGTGPVSFHLGADFFRDDHGVLCMAPLKYIDKLADTYYHLFGEKPKGANSSPLVSGDHPELDTSAEIDEDGIKKYQSLIGSLQWAISLGRFDIATAVMTLSRFRVAPRQGHLERAKRIARYLIKMRNAAIRFRVDLPDHSNLPDDVYDWEKTEYDGAQELIDPAAPPAKGLPVSTTSYVDANLLHDVLSGRSVTGILHFVNQTPIDWYSKRQNTVETATYGSEFIAARLATEQIMDLRYTLRYLGVDLVGPSVLFGDNQSVVNSASIPHAQLHKRHVLLSFHRVREAIAAKIVRFHHIPGSVNPADILSKHWGYQQVWHLIQPILFWQGDTSLLLDNDDD